MKLFLFILLLALTISTYALTGIEKNNTDPEHPGKCVTRGFVLSPGESAQRAGRCHRLTCNNENGDTTIESCTVELVALPCVVSYKYPRASFPKCCETEYKCPEGYTPRRVL